MKHHIWKKLSSKEIKATVFSAINQNVNYKAENILGIPASHLDEKVFSQDEHFLQEAPFISTMVQNPNHIGCHITGTSEPFFKGTQSIEQETIELCAVDILNAESNSSDGYIASGGTEANIQAIWMYRNYFIQEHNAAIDEIGILTSVDSHYSMDKAANLLNIPIEKVQVGSSTRKISKTTVSDAINTAKNRGVKYFITIANMMTTMYGSVDDVTIYTDHLIDQGCKFKLHIDGAYGGFYFPFSQKENKLDFRNEHVSSVTLDAHKMAQAPYGTGIFICRKRLIQYTTTAAGYVQGDDFTLIGSRSGANAIAVWMILMTYGPHGWFEKVYILQKRTEWMCEQLDLLEIRYVRNPAANIITIDANYINDNIAKKYGLVPDNHSDPNWYKIVVMEHVTIDKLQLVLHDLKQSICVTSASF